MNLYRRVNECFPKGEEPLHAWWALLPPPLDVVVGFRQVHYLSEYWKGSGGSRRAATRSPRSISRSSARRASREGTRTPSVVLVHEGQDGDVPLLKDGRCRCCYA